VGEIETPNIGVGNVASDADGAHVYQCGYRSDVTADTMVASSNRNVHVRWQIAVQDPGSTMPGLARAR